MNTSLSTAAIILAAGSSSRMGEGRHKLLLPLAGRPVLAYVIEAALASQARPIIVVLGHQASDVRTQIAPYMTQPGVIIVENPDYMQGMSTSMRVGLESLMLSDIPLTSTHNSPPAAAKKGKRRFRGTPPSPRQGASPPAPPSYEGTLDIPKVGSALIMLGDQPLISPHNIDQLIS